MIVQFIVSIIATLSFAILFAAPKSQLFLCGLNGGISWIVYLLFMNNGFNLMTANLAATFILTLISRMMAAVKRYPVTVYLIAAIFPLVPGAGIYYTSYYFIMNEMDLAASYGANAVKAAGAIALGIVFGFAPPQKWFLALTAAIHSTRGTHHAK